MLEIAQKRLTEFWDNVEKTDGCWYWRGYTNKRWGYGYSSIQGKLWRVHRFVYTLLVGDIPEGLHLDHLCKNRICVNPNHLEPVTNKENVLRGDGLTAVNARKQVCIRGHNLSGNNLYITPSGHRNCKECLKLSRSSYRARQTKEA